MHEPLLTNKVVVVTGAGRGIGRAIAMAMADEGAAVALAARSADEIDSVAEEIERSGGQAIAVPTDVGEQEQVDSLFERVARDLGEVDVLVANAAKAGPVGWLWNMDIDAWQDVFGVNVLGVARCAKAVLPSMIEKKHGKILIVGSMAGRSESWAASCPEQMAYGSSKAAVQRFSECLAAQVAGYGINVNCIGVSAHTRLGDDSAEFAQQGQEGFNYPTVDEIPAEQRVLPEENVAPFVFLASSPGDHITGSYFEANKLPDIVRARLAKHREG